MKYIDIKWKKGYIKILTITNIDFKGGNYESEHISETFIWSLCSKYMG